MDIKETSNVVVDTPNFLRLAKELSRFKNPYKAADTILLFIKDGMEDSTYAE